MSITSFKVRTYSVGLESPFPMYVASRRNIFSCAGAFLVLASCVIFAVTCCFFSITVLEFFRLF